MLLQVGTGDGISSLGVGVQGFRHFEAAGRGRGDDYYQAKFRYGGEKIQQQLAAMNHDSELAEAQQDETTQEASFKTTGQRMLDHVRNKFVDTLGAAAGKSTTLLSSVRGNGHSSTRQSLLEPDVYPQVGYPFEQKSIDTAVSDGPAKTFDSPPDITCPTFIPNCKPQYNTLKECDFSCGSYCQAIRGDGPCLSGDSAGEGRDCKFGYRGASQTPSLADEEESGWLEKASMWAEGGPKDCMTVCV